MAEKEYIISLKRDVDYTAFADEMSAGYGRGLITDRIVAVSYTHLTLPTTPYV